MKSNARLLVKGSGLGVFEFFFVAIVALAMTPFIIRSLGDNMYGLWIFIGSFLGYYGLLDLGLSSAVQRFLSRAIGSYNKDEENQVINTALAMFTLLGLIVIILSSIIAFGLPVAIKNITQPSLFRQVILILGLNLAIAFPLQIFMGILSAHIRHDLNTLIYLTKFIIRTILVIIFLKIGYGIMALALITLATDVVGYAAHYFIVRKLYKHIIFSVKLVNKSLIKPLFGYSVYSFISNIADLLRFNIDNLVITIFLGLSSVTLYSIAARLVKYFIRFMISSVGLFKPLFSQYEARGDFDSIREKFILTTKISSYLAILIGAIIIIFGKAFIQTWVGEKYLAAYPILIILVVPLIFGCMQSPSGQLLYGISKHKFYAISNSIEGVANLILSLILVRKFGLIGIALGTAIPMFIIKLFVQPVYVCKAIKLDIKKYYFGVLLPTIMNSGAVLIVFWFVIRSFISTDYFRLTFLISAGVVLFAACIFFIGFKEFERDYFKKVIFSTKSKM